MKWLASFSLAWLFSTTRNFGILSSDNILLHCICSIEPTEAENGSTAGDGSAEYATHATQCSTRCVYMLKRTNPFFLFPLVFSGIWRFNQFISQPCKCWKWQVYLQIAKTVQLKKLQMTTRYTCFYEYTYWSIWEFPFYILLKSCFFFFYIHHFDPWSHLFTTGGPQPWNQGPANTPPGVMGNVPPGPPGPPQVLPQDANTGMAPGAPGAPAPLVNNIPQLQVGELWLFSFKSC